MVAHVLFSKQKYIISSISFIIEKEGHEDKRGAHAHFAIGDWPLPCGAVPPVLIMIQIDGLLRPEICGNTIGNVFEYRRGSCRR